MGNHATGKELFKAGWAACEDQMQKAAKPGEENVIDDAKVRAREAQFKGW